MTRTKAHFLSSLLTNRKLTLESKVLLIKFEDPTQLSQKWKKGELKLKVFRLHPSARKSNYVVMSPRSNKLLASSWVSVRRLMNIHRSKISGKHQKKTKLRYMQSISQLQIEVR